MSLKVWLPLNGNLENKGLENLTITNNNVTTNANGKIGSCYYFNGTDARISCSSVTYFFPLSICAWIKGETITNSATEYMLSYNTASGGTAGHNIGIGTYGGKLSIWHGGSVSSYNVALTNNIWYHIAAVVTQTGYRLYLDGSEILSSTGAQFDVNSSWLTFGARSNSNTGGAGGAAYYFKGYMNDIRVYNHALSPLEVKEIAQGLVLHYKLNGFQGGYGNKNLLARYVVPGQAAPTSTANGGRTTWLGDYKITIPATENADTYFRLFMTEQLISGTIYTISCKVSGLLSGSYYKFPLFSQSNTSMGVLNLDHNGLCSLTFTMNWTGTQTAATGADGEIVYVNFLDDSARALASGQGAITLYDFKLEKGSSATEWCPSNASLVQVQDSSGYGYNGEVISELHISNDSARYKNSTLFDGVDDCIIVPYNTVCPENIFTINLWFKKDVLGSKNYETLFGGPGGFEMDTRAGSATSLSLYMASTRSGNRATGITMNEWHMITMTRDGTIEKYYVDGEFKSEIEAKPMPNGVYRIGAWASNTGQNYYGLISDFRIYCTALLDADIKKLYNTSMSIDNNQNIHVFESNENKANKLTKSGILYDGITESYLTLSDGSNWKLLLYHYVDYGNNLFTSSNATYCNDFGLYSRLQDINKYMYDGKYEFYVIQDGTEYRWTQTSQPTASSIAGLTTVSGYTDPVNGLAKASQSNTYIGYGSWWGACGCWTKYSTGGKTGIPGFGPHNAQGICEKYLALYVRIPSNKNAKLKDSFAEVNELIER